MGNPIGPAEAEELREPRELLEPHRTVLEGLRLESGYGAEQFAQLFELVLLQMAEYLYLLPATRAENHIDPGGLLRLAVETASLAFRRAEGQFLTGPVQTDVRNRERDRIWRYAIFLAALFRPVGRCCTSMRVLARSGERAWIPHQEGLWGWLNREDIRDFEVEWRDNTDMRPERASSVWLAARLIPQPALRYLSPAGERVMEALVQMTVGASAGRVCEIVEEAQQAAIERDLLRLGRTRSGNTLDIPLEHRLLDAIRVLIREKWTLNTPGGRLWVTHQGVFLAWKAAVTDIAVKLRADGVGGVPRDADTLAEILLARGALVSNSDSTSVLKHYYRIIPIMRGVPKQPIDVVKFADAEMVGLSANGVEPVEVELAGLRTEGGSVLANARPPPRAPPARSVRVGGTSSSKAAGVVKGSLELPFVTGPALGGEPTTNTKLKPPAAEADRPPIEVGSNSLPDSDTGTVSAKSASTAASETSRVENSPPVSQGGNPDQPLSSSHPGLVRLAQFGAAGPTLRALGERLLREPQLTGVISIPEGIAIAYPQAIAAFCPEPQHFLSACESQGLLVADKSAAGRLVRQRGSEAALPEQYIVLSPRVARYLTLQPMVTTHVVPAS